MASNPASKRPSGMPKMLGRWLNNSLIFFGKIWPAGATLNGSHIYLPNGQENVSKNDDFSLCFRLLYPELASISVRYLTPTSLWSMLFGVWPLWIGLINVLFSCTWSRHSLTFPFAVGTQMKQLHYSDVLSTPNGAMIYYLCSHSSSSFKWLL